MRVVFNLDGEALFNVDGGVATIDAKDNYVIYARKHNEGENTRYTNLLDADEFITKQTRTLEEIIKTWKHIDTGLPLSNYVTIIKDENTTEDVNDTQEKIQNPLANALATVLQELYKPKNSPNNALNAIENRLKQLVNIEERKIVMLERKDTIKGIERHTWNKTVHPDMNFSTEISGHNLEDLKNALFIKNALLLRGVPGTGKTRIMTALAYNIVNGDTSRIKLINMNQNTEYADFIGGLTLVNGNWQYSDGTLTQICKDADADRDNIYILCMDEISRSNFASVIGELMTGIEHRDKEIDLPNGSTLLIPSNLCFIATMNTLDITTTKIDKATEERFIVEDILPQWNREYIDWLTSKKSVDTNVKKKLYKLANIMKHVNKLINDNLTLKDQVIGTRAISGIELNNENINKAIRNRLLIDINERNNLMRNECILTKEMDVLEELCHEEP